MPVADTNLLYKFNSFSQVESSLSLCLTHRHSPSVANRIRHLSHTKNSRIKTVHVHRDSREGLNESHIQNKTPHIYTDEAVQVKERRDDGEQGAMSRRLAQLAEGNSLEERLQSKGSLDCSADVEVYYGKNEATPTANVHGSKYSNKAIMTDKVAAAATTVANAKAKAAALAVAQLNRHGSLSSASSTTRLANARVRSAQYTSAKAAMDNVTASMTPAEREAYRAELRVRFQSPSGQTSSGDSGGAGGGSSNIVTGLASLANERIDAAIAAGAFQKIPRGTKVRIKRDHNASSPFIDTTEYLMNRMVQRQAIVPPWIEKQQEIAASASRFRARLRADWRRHAARTIASEGGTLEMQMEKASLYALAEANVKPQSVYGQRKDVVVPQHERAGDPASHTVISGKVKTESRFNASSISSDLSSGRQEIAVASQQEIEKSTSGCATAVSDESPIAIESQQKGEQTLYTDQKQSLPEPFRDPIWEAAERSYHTLQIDALNSLTRTYNLQAPDLAKRPYFSLDRELRACYAKVAPQLAEEIRTRALAPKAKVRVSLGNGSSVARHGGGNIIERMGGRIVPVWEDTKPKYGFRELWKDFVAGLKC